MFEEKLSEIFRAVFSLERVRYDQPATDAKEQETLYLEIAEAPFSFSDGIARARVKGKAHMIVENGKLPFGFFAKGISDHPTETKDLFFFDFEENQRLHENIVERGFSFIYFFSGQYDPALGTLNGVTIDVETTPP